jgi:hypothetical protein
MKRSVLENRLKIQKDNNSDLQDKNNDLQAELKKAEKRALTAEASSEVVQQGAKRRKGNDVSDPADTPNGALIKLTSQAIGQGVQLVEALTTGMTGVVHGHKPGVAAKNASKPEVNPSLEAALAKLGNPDMETVCLYTPKEEFERELVDCNLSMNEKAIARKLFAQFKESQ